MFFSLKALKNTNLDKNTQNFEPCHYSKIQVFARKIIKEFLSKSYKKTHSKIHNTFEFSPYS